MAELPFRKHPDSLVQQIVEPLRRELNSMNRQLDGVTSAVATSRAGAIKFAHVGDTLLPDATTITIQHGLKTKMRGWVLSDLRGASTSGRIERILAGDETKEVKLQANGYGATITVRLLVY